jgi:hypothetical protein
VGVAARAATALIGTIRVTTLSIRGFVTAPTGISSHQPVGATENQRKAATMSDVTRYIILVIVFLLVLGVAYVAAKGRIN